MAQEHTEMCVSKNHAHQSGCWSLRVRVTTAFVAPMSQNRALWCAICLLGAHVQGPSKHNVTLPPVRQVCCVLGEPVLGVHVNSPPSNLERPWATGL